MADPEYDIAISFLHQDEPLAVQLESMLSPSFNVFVYSKKQEQVAGTDGLETFRQVFREQSRLVVVLYRDGWGQSNWTRVEEGAITDRFLHEGWDWLLFVMLDSKGTPPKWLPETRIRLPLQEYGIDQCVGAIKARVQELGGVIHRETAIDRAKRLERDMAWERERKVKLGSEQGVLASSEQAELFLEKLEATLMAIQSSASNMHIKFGRRDSRFGVRSSLRSMTVAWVHPYGNVLDNSGIQVRLLKGQVILPNERNMMYLEEPKVYATYRFSPDITREFGWCWQSPDGKHLSSEQLSEYCANLFINSLEEAK